MIIHRRCHYCLLTRPSHNPVQGVLTINSRVDHVRGRMIDGICMVSASPSILGLSRPATSGLHWGPAFDINQWRLVAVDHSTNSLGDKYVFSSPDTPRLRGVSRCGDLLGAGFSTRVGRFDLPPLVSPECSSHRPRTQWRLLGCLLKGRGLL